MSKKCDCWCRCLKEIDFDKLIMREIYNCIVCGKITMDMFEISSRTGRYVFTNSTKKRPASIRLPTKAVTVA